MMILMNGPAWDFFRLMGAVLAANLLTVAFVWAAMSYSRREQEGREKQPGVGVYLGVMILVFGFLAVGLFASGVIPH